MMTRIIFPALPLVPALAIASLLGAAMPAHAQAPAKKPNILIIFGDDIGISQVSAYTMGLMGYRTPLNASGIGYGMLRQQDALKRLKEIETMSRPGN
jgi:hypothetical protein